MERAAPGGHRLHWVVERVGDEPGRRLAWRSLEASAVEVAGEARLTAVEGGTDVTLSLRWTPPSGWLGALVARVARDRAGAAIENVLHRAQRRIEQPGNPSSRDADRRS